MLSTSIFAQSSKKIIRKREVPKTPLYQGTTIGLDLFGGINSIFGSSFMSTEVNATVNLDYKWYPVVEVGYGTTNTTSDDNGSTYKTAAPYFRVGVNYSLTKKSRKDSHLFAGVRYGFSAFSYDVTSPDIEDGIWKDKIPYAHQGIKSNAHWLELLLGVKAKVYKNFQMGWTIRYKSPLSIQEDKFAKPWYIPGFGKNKSSNFYATYSIIYKLPF